MAERVGNKDVDGALLEAIRDRMAQVITRNLGRKTASETCISGLSIHRQIAPVGPNSYFFEPSFTFTVRGTKRVVLGGETYAYDQSHFLLTAINLPTVMEVLEASEDHPYMCVMQKIDLELARSLITEMDASRREGVADDAGLVLGPVTIPLATATMNLIDLIETPQDAPLLARSIQREILVRLLASPVGGRLRQAVQVGTPTSGISNALRWIREHFSEPLRVQDLARIACMGESTFHHHFRALTTMSPLQYQKQLRLHEARRLMINDKLDASLAAHRVGYESATQFNREYRRLFGAPPKRDIRSITFSDRAFPDEGFPITGLMQSGSATMQ
ncbi:AraC family transcriptional regulator [Sphingomonadaceae bacterium jetA1]|jgi:AraC-like DNA-binding protein|uniref:AraC family transcriptional regulator n=1 Tax=Facivitalis istanbulensis TaxID=3075838 RepID=UPI003477DC1D